MNAPHHAYTQSTSDWEYKAVCPTCGHLGHYMTYEEAVFVARKHENEFPEVP